MDHTDEEEEVHMVVAACDIVLRDLEVSLCTVRRCLQRLPHAEEIARLAREADAEALANASVRDRPVPPPGAIPAMIDHTLLRADATPADIERLCGEAREYRFAAVCVGPRFVPLAARLVWGSGVRIVTVIGFPLGASATVVKALEALVALEEGAHEVDAVLPLGALKAGRLEEVGVDMASVVAVAHAQHAVVKIIVEMLKKPLLTPRCGRPPDFALTANERRNNSIIFQRIICKSREWPWTDASHKIVSTPDAGVCTGVLE